MVTQPEQPGEQPADVMSEWEANFAAEEAGNTTPKEPKPAPVGDDVPFTMKEAVERGKRIAETAKHGVLRPAYRFMRRTALNAQTATEAFFEGVTGEKKDTR